MRNLTASDKSVLIKLASNLPAGDETRRAILASLNKASAGIDWQLVTGAALAKAVRIFGAHLQSRTNLEGRFYAVKFGRKTVFALDSGVIRLYVVGDDDLIYSLKVHTGLNGVSTRDLQIITRAAAVGMTEEALRVGVYTNGKTLTQLNPDNIHAAYVNPSRVRLTVNAPGFVESFEATADASAAEKFAALLAKAGYFLSAEEIEAAIEVA
jgi:hypothetical protein